jgi:hypothetical protein
MSELKVYRDQEDYIAYDDYALEKAYDKFEADRYIGELKKERDWLAKDRAQSYDDLEKRAQLNIKQEESIRHHKYKRCLAMAGWCEATALWCYQAAHTLPTGFRATLFGKPVMIEPDRLFDRFERLIKWSNRWMNLAKKFKDKEAK